MKALLVCQAGMSTAILCKKLAKEAQKKATNLDIEAVGLESAGKVSLGKDLVLLAPQIKYAAQAIRQEVPAEIPIMILSSQDFGLMNAETIYRKMNQVVGAKL